MELFKEVQFNISSSLEVYEALHRIFHPEETRVLDELREVGEKRSESTGSSTTTKKPNLESDKECKHCSEEYGAPIYGHSSKDCKKLNSKFN